MSTVLVIPLLLLRLLLLLPRLLKLWETMKPWEAVKRLCALWKFYNNKKMTSRPQIRSTALMVDKFWFLQGDHEIYFDDGVDKTYLNDDVNKLNFADDKEMDKQHFLETPGIEELHDSDWSNIDEALAARLRLRTKTKMNFDRPLHGTSIPKAKSSRPSRASSKPKA